jgi:N-acetylglucosamine-6-phosphate deacetylase
MDDGVANLMNMAQLSLREAVRMATVNPARMSGIPSGLWIGAPADLLLFQNDGGIKIEAVYRYGERVAH